MSMTQTQISQALAPAELDRANVYLQQTRDGFIGAIKMLSGAQWTFKPGPDRWSVGEIAEHVLVVHELVLGPIRERLAAAPAAETHPDRIDDFVIQRFADRLTKVAAPEALYPSGRLSRPQVMQQAIRNYQRLKERLESDPELRDHAIESIPLEVLSQGTFRMMDGYQWILAAAAHTERHTKQILELIAGPGFPIA